MSYQCVTKQIMQFLSNFEQPKVLEIGIDKGQSTIPLCHNLSLLNRPFRYDGVDIKVQSQVKDLITNMARIFYFQFEPAIKAYNVRFFERNSLDLLPKLIEFGEKYNLILLDGDHNYHTVYNELMLVDKMTMPSTLIICDDYNTKWAYEELYYSERKEYANNLLATPKQDSEKKGVRPAIEDFVKQSKNKWALVHPSGMDFCILYQRENVLHMNAFAPTGCKAAASQIIEVYFQKGNCPEVNETLMTNLEYIYERKKGGK